MFTLRLFLYFGVVLFEVNLVGKKWIKVLFLRSHLDFGKEGGGRDYFVCRYFESGKRK